MITRKIRDVSVPALGFGTWELTGDTCRKAVETALDIGYRHIDTARMYKNEEEVGQALQGSGIARDDLFVTSKVWHEDLDPDALQAECEVSLENLGLEYLDLYLIHWPNPDIPLEESLGALQQLRDDGNIREFGVSNFPSSLMKEALDINENVFCNQVEYHVFLGQDEVRKVGREADMLITAYCPLAQGDVMANNVLEQIGNLHGKSPAQVALRWLLQQNQVAAIPRSKNPEHIRANFETLDFELSEEEIAKIDALPKDDRKIDPEWAPDWD